jgi:Uma2 family endonuclease
MIATPSPKGMSAEEYLAWEPLQELRYEYVAGAIVAMTGGTVPHNDIAVNVLMALYGAVRAKGCRINIADVKLQVSAKGAYRYPDLVVSCDGRDLQNSELVQFPSLVVEVLSPGTEAVDRGAKFNEYRSLETWQEYVLGNASAVGVEVYRRGEGRMWLYYPYGAGERVVFESLGLELDLAVIYANTTLLDG